MTEEQYAELIIRVDSLEVMLNVVFVCGFFLILVIAIVNAK